MGQAVERLVSDVQENLRGQSSHARVRHEFSLPLCNLYFPENDSPKIRK